MVMGGVDLGGRATSAATPGGILARDDGLIVVILFIDQSIGIHAA
jgi:hypothetical protein